ncbi:MAG: hypothetical protein IPI66_07500 [Chitinophagaceae bacterium]|nr:hypothetical protein [Chitinophagaceae bacterium]MBL0057162.1 hypothetical protein [Chitinophagaceae bacterium]
MALNNKHFAVNWIDGMKVNKNHFVDQDNAWIENMQETAALYLSPIRFGVLPAASLNEDSFNVKLSIDNQNALRVTVLSCQAITPGGVRISIPAALAKSQQDSTNTISEVIPLASAASDTGWWLYLFVHPFEKQPAGAPDLTETPPRLPHVLPTYTLQLISESNFREYRNHPYGLPIGKLISAGPDFRVEDDYLPPCFTVSSHPDLLSLHGELDKYFADIELYCTRIVQKIFIKKQQNDISELVMFLCDRVMIYLGQTISTLRWKMSYEPPAELFMSIASMARIMKNTIDLRIGSGKDEMMNYLSEWCELKQGELETLLVNMANSGFNNNDINKSIQQVVVFVKITSRLFETLSKLEFIGKKKESGVFVKEEAPQQQASDNQQKAKRRFFG